MVGPRRLLVNFVYCHPVGHAIEALHYCHGYHLADPDLRIGLVLNANTPVELASLCPFLEATYPVTVDLFDAGWALAGLDDIPARWDWVVDDGRSRQSNQRALFPGLAAYYDRTGERFGPSVAAIGTAGAAPPGYVRGGHLRLAVPAAASARAGELMARGGTDPSDVPDSSDCSGVRGGLGRSEAWPKIAVLPAGSGPRSNYPSLRSWRLIFESLIKRWPAAQFCVVGKLRRDGRTSTSFGRSELQDLLMTPGVVDAVDAVDRDLIEQLAIVSECDVLISPHSGFGMAGLAVGTPWLTISGNRWPEYYFNGVTFYSVLPDVRRFPALQQFEAEPAPVDDDGPRSPSMCFERVQEDLEEIVEGAARLIERRWPYETALADYFERMVKLREGRAELIWSIDGVHLPYVAVSG